MKRARWISLALAASVALVPREASARDVAIEVRGCVELDSAALGRAVALESANGWVVATRAPTTVRIELRGCDAAEWTLHVLDAAGASRLGPVQITMSGLHEDARTRVASLWIAEWLATLDDDPRRTEPLGDPHLEPTALPSAATAPPERASVEAPAGLPPELRIRVAVLAAFRYANGLWGYLGGADAGLSVAYVDDYGVGLEITVGGLYGSQYNRNDIDLAFGSISAFVLAQFAPWLEVSAGLRGTVEGVVDYHRADLLEQRDEPPHGLLGGFLRGQFLLTSGVTAVADVELAGALSGIHYGETVMRAPIVLMDGLHVTARLGLVIELLPAPTPATGLLDL